ncbi:uncharacterized protein [Vicugna pacos]|uniref:Uncharacterized protein isoform X2 n=1 Tax=Vicugna pacos TaxID=30538 RepID=A0ABM5CA51_VICPA
MQPREVGGRLKGRPGSTSDRPSGHGLLPRGLCGAVGGAAVGWGLRLRTPEFVTDSPAAWGVLCFPMFAGCTSGGQSAPGRRGFAVRGRGRQRRTAACGKLLRRTGNGRERWAAEGGSGRRAEAAGEGVLQGAADLLLSTPCAVLGAASAAAGSQDSRHWVWRHGGRRSGVSRPGRRPALPPRRPSLLGPPGPFRFRSAPLATSRAAGAPARGSALPAVGGGARADAQVRTPELPGAWGSRALLHRLPWKKEVWGLGCRLLSPPLPPPPCREGLHVNQELLQMSLCVTELLSELLCPFSPSKVAEMLPCLGCCRLEEGIQKYQLHEVTA